MHRGTDNILPLCCCRNLQTRLVFLSPFAFAGASLTVQYIMKTSALMFFDDKVLDTGDISANQQKVKDIAVGG